MTYIAPKPPIEAQKELRLRKIEADRNQRRRNISTAILFANLFLVLLINTTSLSEMQVELATVLGGATVVGWGSWLVFVAFRSPRPKRQYEP